MDIANVMKAIRPRGFTVRFPWGRKAVHGLWSNDPAWKTVSGPSVAEGMLEEFYEKNSLVFSCVEELATSVAEPELLVEIRDRKGRWQVAEDHPLGELLDRPNPTTTGYNFWHGVMMFEAIAGNMFYEKERSASGRVVALWPISPDRVRPKLGGDGKRKQLLAWSVRYSGGMLEDLLPRDVIQFKRTNPRNELLGLSPLSVVMRMAGIDNDMTDYLDAFFKNAAVPYGLLTTKHVLDEARIEEIRSKIRHQHTGDDRWHNIMILDEAQAEYQQIGLKPAEIEMSAVRAVSEERICMVFQVPPIVVGALVGLEHATFANYGEARESFWQETLMPHYRRHRDVIQLQLVPEFGDNLRVRWDFSKVNALQENTDLLHTRVRGDFQAGYITVNEARERIGLEAVANGDIFLRPMMMVSERAIPLAGAKAVLALAAPQEEKATGAMEYIWWKALDMTARAWEGPFKRAASERFGEDEERLLAILRKQGKASKAALPFQQFLWSAKEYLETVAQPEWRKVFIPLFRALLTAQGENIAAAWGIDFDVSQPEVIEFLENYSMQFSEGLFEVDAEAISELVQQAQAEGWSVPKIRDAIQQTWGDFAKARAENIARTETIRSSNAGAKQAMKGAGIKVIRWLAAPDDGRRCDFCAAMDGKVIDIERNFFEKDDELTIIDSEGRQQTLKFSYGAIGYPPAHVNCRCTIVGVFEEVG